MNQAVCRQISLVRLFMSDRAQDDRQSFVFLSHIHNCRGEEVCGLGRNELYDGRKT